MYNQTHSKEAFLYTLSKALERASYYGLRSLLILYMLDSFLKMKITEAYSVYGWFIFSLLFFKIIGAMLGDLIIGNRKAIIIGGIIQALGVFSICIPSITGLYIGLFLVGLGGGLYTPNITSNFGKLYLDKPKLIDAGFAILYLAASLGALLAVITIGNTGENYGWNFGFTTAGVLMLLSIIPIIISKDNKTEQTTENVARVNYKIMNIIIAFVFIIVSLYWIIYRFGNIQIIELQQKLRQISTINIPKSLWTYLDSVFVLPISLLAIITWTYFYINQFFKLLIGLVFGATAFAIIFLIPEIPKEEHIIIYFISLIFLGISEIHIAPVFYSILTKNCNPKYLAILISLTYIPTRLFYGLFGLFSEKLYKDPMFSLKFALIAMILLSFGLIIFVKWKKKQ